MANIKLTANETRFVQAMERAAGSVGKLSAELNFKLAHSLKEVDAISNRFQQGFGKLGDKIQSVGQSMSTYLTVPLTLVSGAALSAYSELDSLKKSLLSIEGTLPNVEKRLTQLREAAKLPGLGFQEAIQGDVRLRSVGIAAETSLRILKEFGNANALTGGGKEQLSQIISQLSQMAAKGKVAAQDLKPIIEAAPSVSTAIKKLFGTVDSEGIQNKLAAAGKSSADFINELLTELEKAPRVAGGFKNAMENAKDSLFVAAAGFGEALNKAFGLEGILNKLSDKLNELTTWFQGLSPEVQKTIFVVGGLVAIAGPLITAFGFIVSSVIPLFITGIGTISAPIIAAGAVIAIVAANIIKYWDNIKNALVNTGVWSGVAEVFKAGLNLLGDYVGVFISLFTADWEGLWENLKNIMKRIWNGIIEVFTFPLKTILQLQQSVASALGFVKLSNGFGYALGIVNQLTNKIKADIPESTNNLKKLADAFNNLGGNSKSNTLLPPVDTSKALKELEKQRAILGNVNVSTIVNSEVKGIDKIVNPDRYTKNVSYADELLAAGKRLKEQLPPILSQIDLSSAGLSLEEQIRKNVTDKAKLAFTEFQNEANAMFVQLQQTLVTDFASGIGEAIGSAIGGAGFGLEKVFQSILQTIGGFMISLGKQMLIAGQAIEWAKRTFGTSPAGAIALIAAGGIIKGLAGTLFSQTPKFAQGGMVTGPTFAMMGDNASGREMALPWERTSEFAKNIASYMGGGGGMSMVEVKIKGEDLYAVLQLHKKNNGY